MKKGQYVFLALFVLSTLFFVGCTHSSKVVMGDIVQIQYVASFPDGTLFQSGQKELTIGSGSMVIGLEQGLIGMKAGQTKKMVVIPSKGYGDQYDPLHLQKISKLLFDKIIDSIGEKTRFISFAGVTGVVKGIEKDEKGNEIVLRDINPRETRDNLMYEVTLLSKK